MTEGIDRSTLPGPVVMTIIWPSDTSTVKDEKVRAAERIWSPPRPPEIQSVTSQVRAVPTNDQIQGAAPMRRPSVASIRRPPWCG